MGLAFSVGSEHLYLGGGIHYLGIAGMDFVCIHSESIITWWRCGFIHPIHPSIYLSIYLFSALVALPAMFSW